MGLGPIDSPGVRCRRISARGYPGLSESSPDVRIITLSCVVTQTTELVKVHSY